MSTSATQQQPKTIADVEQDGKWVCQRHSGHAGSTILLWREQNLLVKRRHFKEVRVKTGAAWHGKGTRTVTFYRKARLERLSKKDPRQKVTDHNKALRKEQKEKVIDGVLHLRSGPAATFLGVSKTLLPELGIVPKTIEVMRRDTTYWSKPELQNWKQENKEAQRIPKGHVSLKRACRIIKRHENLLRNEKWCQVNGITPNKTTYIKNGRGHALYFFNKKECLNFDPKPTLLEGRTTAAEAAKTIGCTRGTVATLCREKILDAVWRDVTPQKKGWLIKEFPDEESTGPLELPGSVSEIATFVRSYPSLIKAGWALREKKANSRGRAPAPAAVANGQATMPSAASMGPAAAKPDCRPDYGNVGISAEGQGGSPERPLYVAHVGHPKQAAEGETKVAAKAKAGRPKQNKHIEEFLKDKLALKPGELLKLCRAQFPGEEFSKTRFRKILYDTRKKNSVT